MPPLKNAKPGDPCKRCRPSKPSVLVARGEPFCEPCFHKFLSSKVRKQTEEFKVAYTKNKEPIPTRQHVIVPVMGRRTNTSREIEDAWPFGASDMQASLGLLDLIADIIREQKSKHRGRQGLYIHLVEIGGGEPLLFDLIKDRFESEILSYSFFDLATNKLKSQCMATPEFSTVQNIDTQISSTLAKLATRASRSDALLLAIRDLVPKIVQALAAPDQQFGDLPRPWMFSHLVSETVEAVAQQILTDVAKGRMNLVYQDMLVDGSGRLPQVWPLKDIKTTEVEQFLDLEWTQTKGVISELGEPNSSVSKKNMSLDSLIRSYFGEIDASFPSVAATVVRTIEKLADPRDVLDSVDPMLGTQLLPSYYVKNNQGLPETAKLANCKVCGCARNPNTVEWIAKITVNEAASVEDEEPGSVTNGEPEAPKLLHKDMCYGCIVMMKDSEIELLDSGLPNWRCEYEQVSRNNSVADVLKQYEL